MNIEDRVFVVATKEGVTFDWLAPLDAMLNKTLEETHTRPYYYIERGNIIRVVGDSCHT
jgi:hypothetical protein